MADIELIETVDSHEGQVSPDPLAQATIRQYMVAGTDDELTARQTLESNIPAFLNGNAFNSYRLVPGGAGLWKVTVTYGRKKPAGLVTLNFDTGEDTVRVTQAQGGSAYYPAIVGHYGLADVVVREAGLGYNVGDVLTINGAAGDTPVQMNVLAVTDAGGVWLVLISEAGNITTLPPNPITVTGGSGTGCVIFGTWQVISGTAKTVINYQGALGIKREAGQMRAEGIDLPVGAFTFTINRTFGPGFPLTGDFVQLCRLAANTVNAQLLQVTVSGIALTFNPGELRFIKAVGSDRTGGSGISLYPDWEGEVTLSFAAQDNLENATIAGVPGVTKKGWDYIEVVYEDVVVANQLMPQPRQVNVNQVFLPYDHSGFFPDMPTITSMSPDNGSLAQAVTIIGTNFWGVRAVLFNGVSAPFLMTSPTTIETIVPVDATSGPLQVVASGGTANSPTDFTIDS